MTGGPVAETKRRGRGEDSIYRRASDGRWVGAIDMGMVDGKRVRKTVTATTKTEVAKRLKEVRASIDKGVLPSRATTGEWLEWWLEHVAVKKVRERTLQGYRSSSRYAVDILGRVPLQDLRPEHVERMHKAMLDRGLSAGTVRQAHAVLQSALSDALARERVTRNVAKVAKAPRVPLNPHEHLSPAQAKLVLSSAGTPRELARLVCALVLGMRQGEVLALRWEDYAERDGDRVLVVEESVSRITGRGIVRGDVKSLASHRAIPLPTSVAHIFDAWRELAARGEEYIFPGPKGGPEDQKRDWTAWRDALARAGVPHVPLHGARGSAASLLADMGVPDWRIGQILGHTAWVSRRHYIAGELGPKRAALDGLVRELLG